MTIRTTAVENCSIFHLTDFCLFSAAAHHYSWLPQPISSVVKNILSPLLEEAAPSVRENNNKNISNNKNIKSEENQNTTRANNITSTTTTTTATRRASGRRPVNKRES